MLFNSYSFIFLFLPIVLIGFFSIGKRGYESLAIAWLIVASLFFYGWFNPVYLVLILGSIFFNYPLGMALFKKSPNRKALLVFGISVNVLLLGYFKYFNFFIENISAIVGLELHIQHIFLPLAISFFTFQQISYLVDIYRNEAGECSFLHYCFFITFFPKLIAGPIVRYKELIPQLAKTIEEHQQQAKISYRFNSENMSVGLTIFFIGLFKKVVMADGMAVYADQIFNVAASGNIILTFFDSWGGALAYTFQLYFDFSGYTDMATGVARIFGILLPINFYSPYKALNIIDFWRRWHITLSRFLGDYLYIPLGGNRKGAALQYINITITMLLGGLWHGAGWTFVAWGALHGLYLVINHAWRTYRQLLGQDITTSTRLGRGLSQILTFVVVTVAWVFFRAESFKSGLSIVKAMSGLNGIALPEYLLTRLGLFSETLTELGCRFEPILFSQREAIWFLFLSLVVWSLPNTQQILSSYKPTFDTYNGKFRRYQYDWPWLQWKPTNGWAVFTTFVTVYSILGLNKVSDFLYFKF